MQFEDVQKGVQRRLGTKLGTEHFFFSLVDGNIIMSGRERLEQPHGVQLKMMLRMMSSAWLLSFSSCWRLVSQR